jgi:hypothetical protein
MNFHRDNIIKLDYNPVLDASIDYLNAVGATDSLTLRTLDFTPSDANTIYVKKTGNDSTAVGTQADPVLTIKKAESLITATKTNIVILDDGVYEEESLVFDTNCANIAVAIGKKPTVKPVLVASGSNYLIETFLSTRDISTTGMEYVGFEIKSIQLSNGNFIIVYQGATSSVNIDLYYIIIDSDGNVVQPQTEVASGLMTFDVCVLSSGYFAIVYKTSVGTYIGLNVYNNSGGLNYSGNIIASDEDWSAVASIGGYSDRLAIVYSASGNTKFIIADYNGNIIKTETTLISGVYEVRIKPHIGSGFIWVAVEGNTWGVVDKTGASLHSGTIATGCSLAACTCRIIDDSDINDIVYGAVFAYLNSSGNLYILEYSLSDYTIYKSATLKDSSTDTYRLIHDLGIDKTDNDFYLVTFGGNSFGTPGPAKLVILSSEWEVLLSENFTACWCLCCSNNSLSDRVLVALRNSAAPNGIKIQIKAGFITDWWTYSSSMVFNGITFNNEEDFIRKYLYSSSGTLKFKWCTFENIARISYNDSDRYPLYICEATVTAAEILNCEVFNNNAGFKITSNSVQAKNCQFFKQLLKQAIYIIGSGTGIIISHNDFLFNYICIELEDNAGTEVIKNNIFHTSLLYAIKAETAVTYSNSIENSVSYNATPGVQVIRSNPHYINDGYVTLADLDLVLKSRELGYRFESPAIGIGDDLKNAGSLEYAIADGSQTWLTMTVVKPKIKKGYNPVGAIETSYKDGSVESYRDSYSEVLKLEWDSIKEDDFLKLLSLYFSSSNLVRIYLDPIREPGSYGTYALIYDKINASPTNWQFDDIGKNDFDLTFKRAYNEGD